MSNQEIDREIAKLMNDEPYITWEIFDVDETASALSFSTEREAREWLRNKLNDYPGSWLRDSHVGKLEHCLPYSSDISAAMLVVEKIAARNEHTMVSVTRQSESAKVKYFCTIEDVSNGIEEWEASADTAPMAICLAALKAIE